MSINPKSSAEQEQSVPPDGADSGSSSSPRASDRVRRRQIFICYPRDARKDVDRFHETLFEALKKRSRSYEVFRDKGEEHDHRINPGEFWRDVIEAKLESSICCIVALVPAIFESKECRKEITKFQSLIKAGQGRFFFPIDFLEVQPVIRQLAAKKDDIASLMLDLDRCNFVGAGFEDNRAYEKKVDGIADTIHRRINKLLEGTGVGELLPPPPPPPPPPPLRAGRMAALLATGVIVTGALAWAFWPVEPPSIVVGQPLEVVLDLVLPIQLRLVPRFEASEAAEMLGPGLIKAGDGNIRAIRLGKLGNTEWYELEFASGVKRYVEKNRIPVWAELDADTELVKPVPARSKPLFNAETVRLLAPDGLGPSRSPGRPHRTGRIDDVLWYRITQPDFDVFFSERDATGALTRWTSYTGCLQANESVRAQSAIFEGRPLEEFCCGEPLYGALQMADVQGEKWIRYRRTDGSFGYLRMTMLKACAGN